MLELTRYQQVFVLTSWGWQKGLVCREVSRGLWEIRIAEIERGRRVVAPKEALFDLQEGYPVVYVPLGKVRPLQNTCSPINYHDEHDRVWWLYN